MTTFLNLLGEDQKERALQHVVQCIRAGTVDGRVFSKAIDELRAIPTTPFAYWITDRVGDVYKTRLFDDETQGRTTRCGLSTLDNFRFIRAFWEVQSRNVTWCTYYHGGVFSRFYDNFPLVVNWRDKGKEVKAFVEKKVGSASRKVQGEDKYFQEGFVFPRRTKAFSPKMMPSGGIFSTAGQAGFAARDELVPTIALLASKACTFLISLAQGRTGDAAQFEVGLVKRLPWPSIDEFRVALEQIAHRSWRLRRTLDSINETSYAFLLPSSLRVRLLDYDATAAILELTQLQEWLDKIGLEAYGLEHSDCIVPNQTITASEAPEPDGDELDDADEVDDSASLTTEGLLSWAVGVVFGRFDWRLATGERVAPPDPDPFDPLPAKSPGMLPDGAAPFHTHTGILIDDPGDPHDLAQLVEEVLGRVEASVTTDVRRWLQRDFFAFHLQRYSKSRRKAPIYWPLSTTSGSYTLWIYYPNLSSQTLYTAINDVVEPKLKQVGAGLTALRSKGAARTREDEGQFETLHAFEQELIELRDTLLKLAPIYKPNHDDGVQISAAPLWPLFRHKPWQKLLKDTWSKLEKGDYDWAYLAMNYWPDRVQEKCKLDKSLAIAHGLEELFQEPEARPQKSRRRKARGGIE